VESLKWVHHSGMAGNATAAVMWSTPAFGVTGACKHWGPDCHCPARGGSPDPAQGSGPHITPPRPSAPAPAMLQHGRSPATHSPALSSHGVPLSWAQPWGHVLAWPQLFPIPREELNAPQAPMTVSKHNQTAPILTEPCNYCLQMHKKLSLSRDVCPCLILTGLGSGKIHLQQPLSFKTHPEE